MSAEIRVGNLCRIGFLRNVCGKICPARFLTRLREPRLRLFGQVGAEGAIKRWGALCRSGALGGADGAAFEFVADLVAGLFQLFLGLGDFDAVEDVLQAVFLVEVADRLKADDGGQGAVGEALDGAVDEGGDGRSEEGNGVGGIAHGLDDGVSDLEGAESEGDEGIAHDGAEDLDEARVGGAEAVQKDDVLDHLQVDDRDEQGVGAGALRDGGIGGRFQGAFEDDVLCGLFHLSVVEGEERRLDSLVVSGAQGSAQVGDEFAVIPADSADAVVEIHHFLGDIAAHFAVMAFCLARVDVIHVGDVPSKSEPNSALISSIVAVFEPSL